MCWLVDPLHPNTFHRLFQHSTQPQLSSLISQISGIVKLNEVVIYTLASLGLVMVYLAEMAYVVLLHLLYLLTSILGFNLLQKKYVDLVRERLKVFMSKIRAMLVESSVYLYGLMKILIKLFCVLINGIFFLIKGKLLFYLKLVQLRIDIDMLQLYFDIKSYNKRLLELQSEFHKYILISQSVNQLLKALTELVKDNEEFKKEINEIINGNEAIKKVHRIFYYKNDKISKILKDLSPITMIKSIELTPDKNPELVMNLKMNLGNLQKHSQDIMTMNLDNSFIFKFNKCVCSIKNMFNMIDMADLVVSTEIMSIIGKLSIMETINFIKLNFLITQIQMLYYIILARGYLLICTIEFYEEIRPSINSLCESLKFESCNAREFLSSCIKVENYILTLSSQINKCIQNLAQIANKYKINKFQKLKELLLKLIGIILVLKFYVDLMAMEILIFKNVIDNLITVVET